MGGNVTKPEALDLCARWLPLLTGNRPEELVTVFTEDVFYRDPARPDGVQGKPALLTYFRQLLAAFPDWVWTVVDVWPTEGGFTLGWRVKIPVGANVIEETGMDIVLVRDGLIARSEVSFDGTMLLVAMKDRGCT